MPRYTQRTRFTRWWTTDAENTAEQTADKCEEYGSHDLYGIGHNVAKMAGVEVDNTLAFELGCLFYLLGKVERAMSAAIRQEAASDDTYLDLAVYATMVRAHRAGVWPNGKTDKS